MVIHPPIYGAGPFPKLGRFDGRLITMINPCAVKGIAIFLALADRFGETQFAALPGWGTTAADLCELGKRANIQVLESVRDIEQVLAETRVLLMPSLWYEGFGLSVMEAMLRGIPAIASNSGGLVEAKRNTRFVIPVGGIERFEPVFDEHGMPRAVLPEIDVEPWADALAILLTNREAYEQIAEESRCAALEFVRALEPDRMAEFLAALEPAAVREGAKGSGLTDHLRGLSPEKRALLLRRLRQKAGA